MKFKVSCNDLFRRTAIIVEVNERNLKKKNSLRELPTDYWDFIPREAQQEESCTRPNKRVLSPAQVAVLSYKNVQHLCFFFPCIQWMCMVFTVS